MSGHLPGHRGGTCSLDLDLWCRSAFIIPSSISSPLLVCARILLFNLFLRRVLSCLYLQSHPSPPTGKHLHVFHVNICVSVCFCKMRSIFVCVCTFELHKFCRLYASFLLLTFSRSTLCFEDIHPCCRVLIWSLVLTAIWCHMVSLPTSDRSRLPFSPVGEYSHACPLMHLYK